jgi:hypothetical protein
MALTYDGDYVKQVVEIGVGEIDETLEGIDEAFGKSAVGMKEPSAQDLASFFFHQQVMFLLLLLFLLRLPFLLPQVLPQILS